MKKDFLLRFYTSAGCRSRGLFARVDTVTGRTVQRKNVFLKKMLQNRKRSSIHGKKSAGATRDGLAKSNGEV